jgi:hypothetical protein
MPWGKWVALLVAFHLGAPGPSSGAPAAWTPPAPADTLRFDWVRLVSGEWLGGTIESLREEALEFDSDQLEELLLDWEDVVEIRSPRQLEYVYDDDRKITGTAVMAGGVVRVRARGTGEETAFPASSLVSIVEGAVTEWDRWSGKASLGVVLRTGNTNQRDLSTFVFLRRETGETRLDLRGSGNRGTLEGQKSVNNRQASVQLDVFLTRRFYATPLFLEVYTDEFQNIDVRTTATAGLGYDLVDARKVEWSVGLSAGYLRTKHLSVETGTPDVQESGTVIPSMHLEWDPTGDVDVSADYSVTVSTAAVKDAYHHLVALLAVELTDILDLDLSVTWDRVENPRPAEDGTLPERDDLRLTTGLGVDF